MTAIEPLFAALKEIINSSGDLSKAASQAEKILSISPQDEDAFYALLCILINDEKIEKALSLLNNEEKAKKYAFEKAYCYYQLKDYERCRKTLNSNFQSPKPEKVLRLESQLNYRLENFDKSKEALLDLLTNHSNPQSNWQTIINLGAVLTSDPSTTDQMINSFIVSHRNEMEKHDMVYNVACSFATVGDYTSALKYLEQAEAICRKNVDAEDLDSELSPIICQKAFILQSQGKTDESMQLYNTVLKNKPSEAIAAVANNNVVAIKKVGTDLFDSFKKLKQATSSSLDSKLSLTQRKVVGYNNCVILMHMNKGEQCREQLKLLEEQFPHEDRFTLIASSLLFKEKKASQSEELLRKFATEHPQQSERVRLSLAQIHLNKGEIEEGIRILTSISHLQNKAGMVATIASLYQQIGDTKNASDTLISYVKQLELRNLNEEQEEEAKQNLIHIAHFMSEQGKYREVAIVYERLLEIDSNDLFTLSNLVIAYSHFDTKSAERICNQLPALNLKEEEDFSGEELENMAAPKLSFKSQQNQEGESNAKLEKNVSQRNPKTKKKKKKLLPKDLSKPLDPERWIPLVKRSYYKKKTRKGKMERGSQGAVLKQAASGSVTVTATTPSPVPIAPVASAPVVPKNRGKKRR
eukprot:TRINITY_DN1673_c0_g1_i1.p1 TRINITY_DN1673_c0_g1~~TRINITY_DN1673_c0_g1_i1.p1  ORF type:complete len:639 (+),score=156.76 TRINITY_DN1673_c0_g1_i1:212-2128(+)